MSRCDYCDESKLLALCEICVKMICQECASSSNTRIDALDGATWEEKCLNCSCADYATEF